MALRKHNRIDRKTLRKRQAAYSKLLKRPDVQLALTSHDYLNSALHYSVDAQRERMAQIMTEVKRESPEWYAAERLMQRLDNLHFYIAESGIVWNELMRHPYRGNGEGGDEYDCGPSHIIDDEVIGED